MASNEKSLSTTTTLQDKPGNPISKVLNKLKPRKKFPMPQSEKWGQYEKLSEPPLSPPSNNIKNSNKKTSIKGMSPTEYVKSNTIKAPCTCHCHNNEQERTACCKKGGALGGTASVFNKKWVLVRGMEWKWRLGRMKWYGAIGARYIPREEFEREGGVMMAWVGGFPVLFLI